MKLQETLFNLAEHSYAVFDSFLDEEELAKVLMDFESLRQQGLFQNAKIGKETRERNAEIRGDLTHWIEEKEASDAQKTLLDRLEVLRSSVNRELFLGLERFEGHYAIYPKGSFYKKHLDRFSSDDTRTLSVVLYLNPTWNPAWGGALRLYLGEETFDIEPKPGRLVLFLSDQIPHEVLTTESERRSFTGWFKRKPIGKIF
jgi:SM-20-related protein